MTGRCEVCGAELAALAEVGRPRRYCSTGCRSAAARARQRERTAAARWCAAEAVGRRCDREARFALVVESVTTHLCGPCHDRTVDFLLERGVDRGSVVSTPLTEPAPEAVPRRPEALETPRSRLLVIEDDSGVAEALTTALSRDGHRVRCVVEGRAGLRAAYTGRPDLVLLDLGLPDMDGLDVLRKLREVSDVPVMVLTARGDTRTVLRGFALGADDYVVKPVPLAELRARLGRLLHRQHARTRWAEPVYDDGVLRLDSTARVAHVNGTRLPLTPREFRLLDLLVRHADAVQPLDRILREVWDEPEATDGVRVKFAISRLRQKLEATALGSACIVSARGIGYLYRPHARPSGPHTTGSGYGHAERVRRALEDQ
ncbi:two-component system KDP operon response regulator KdpE [Crossiella equi]|uniref:Two-component system KDP operon response regulator KdpE n=1 Tax=Crossiella equi TaxID=130796 RepID=A0ABS5AQQ3_9PSEU|nr:response regulator transcription factor [Crossiella equi]MBP2478886.1 two-component system KDP operon response regulator KdpE [Crossiella equi]